MRTPRITPIAVIAVVALVASAVVVRAEHTQVSLNPDRVLKGTTPTITITLDKSIPDQKEIKSVRIGGQVVTVQEPNAEGKLSVPLPKLDIVGRADVDVIGKDDKSVAVGQLTYVESAEASSNVVVGPSSREFALLVIYIGLIVLLPLICTIYDIRKSYRERADVFVKLHGHPTIDEIGALLTKMDQGPTGLVGLTRGLLALTLVLAVAFAAFHLIVFAPARVPDIADKLLMLLAGTLTAITGFYFGSKAATEAAQQQTEVPKGEVQSSGVPKILKVDQGSGTASRELTVAGEGFGSIQGKGVVKVGNKDGTVTTWNDQQIKLTVPPGVQGNVDVVVTSDNGNSSDPYQIAIAAAP